MAATIRKRFGPYRVLNIVYSTKTSQVVEAINDLRNGDKVAIKLLQPETCLKKEHVNLLKHEFSVGRRLSHENVIEFFEFHTDRTLTYLTMEFFPSLNLKQIIQQSRDDVAHLLPSIVQQAAAGLAHLNELGWVHRDVKPDNFLCDEAGHVKLIDFALALRPKTGLSRIFAGKTKIQGTRSYISPEQLRAGPFDVRADVYSFGCMLFELFSGKPPYTADNPNELLNKHLRAPVPQLAVSDENITRPFAQLVQRMLSKNPGDRPRDMTAFLDEFKDMRVYYATPKPPVAAADRTQSSADN